MQKRFKSVSLMLLLMGLPSGFAMAETAPVETYAVTQQKSPCKGTVVVTCYCCSLDFILCSESVE